jgi:hypothetical protein
MCWLCLGSSTRVLYNLDRFNLEMRLAGSDYVSITSNRGIRLISPTYYFLSDQAACRNYLPDLKRHKHTITLTLKREDSALRARGLEYFQEFVREGHPYEPFKLSGLWCIEYACRHGASELLIVGMDGYRWAGDRFGEDHPRQATNHNEAIIEPQMAILVKKYPAVQFIFYGKPLYQVAGPNVEIR